MVMEDWVPRGPAKSADSSSFAFSDAASDIAFLERIRWFRMSLIERICTSSTSQSDKVLVHLRQEPTSQMAEFFYLLDCQQIRTVGQLQRLAELHNAYVVAVTKDKSKMRRLGLTSDRLLDAMFTSDTMPRLLQNWQEEPGAIDQSNLARFLGVVMSPETCRKTVVACAEAGFLVRRKSPYGTFIVKSAGDLERVFGSTLREASSRNSK